MSGGPWQPLGSADCPEQEESAGKYAVPAQNAELVTRSAVADVRMCWVQKPREGSLRHVTMIGSIAAIAGQKRSAGVLGPTPHTRRWPAQEVELVIRPAVADL